MKAFPFLRPCLLLPVVFAITVWAAKPEDFRYFDKLRSAASSVSGWTEKEDKYLTFTPKELYYIIGKGAKEFEKQGLKKGVSILLLNGDKIVEAYFADFGKFSKAKGMVYLKKKSAPNAKEIPAFNVAPLYFDEVTGGCVVYLAKANIYVEMTLSGYDTSEKAISEATTLINKICAVIP